MFSKPSFEKDQPGRLVPVPGSISSKDAGIRPTPGGQLQLANAAKHLAPPGRCGDAASLRGLRHDEA
jgi:hypothetical protein